MRASRFTFLWVVFASAYVVFCGIIFAALPERDIYFFIREHYKIFLEENAWDTIFMLTVLLSALAINIVFIFFSFTVVQRLRNRSEMSG